MPLLDQDKSKVNPSYLINYYSDITKFVKDQDYRLIFNVDEVGFNYRQDSCILTFISSLNTNRTIYQSTKTSSKRISLISCLSLGGYLNRSLLITSILILYIELVQIQ